MSSAAKPSTKKVVKAPAKKPAVKPSSPTPAAKPSSPKAEKKADEKAVSRGQSSFCAVCRNMLTVVISDDNQCQLLCQHGCGSVYPARPTDTLRYRETKKTDAALFAASLDSLADDATVLLVERECPACGHQIAKQAELSDEVTVFACCAQCGHLWAPQGRADEQKN